MPFFYRGPQDKTPNRSRSGMRVATTLALAAYPLGCVLRLVLSDTSPEPGLTVGEMAGFALILTSLAAFCFIAPSWLQRIVGEETRRLDEFELDLRRRAYAFSYQAFTGLTVLFAVYMGFAADQDGSGVMTLWTPTTFDHWSAIFWGAMLYAFILPTAWLSWVGPARLDMGDDEVQV